MKKAILWIVCAIFSLFCDAKELRRTFEDTGFLGHGEAGIASVSGVASLYYNPAGLAFGDGSLKQLSILDPQVTASDEVIDYAKNNKKYENMKLTPQEVVNQVEGRS